MCMLIQSCELHDVIMQSICCLGLWVTINWFVLNVGLADPHKQEAEIFGTREAGGEDRNTEVASVSDEVGERSLHKSAEDKKAK